MSLFGNSTSSQKKPSMFGSVNTSTSQPQQSNNVFGGFGNGPGAGAQPAPTPSLFGNAASTQPPTNSLFGNATQPAQAQSTSLFGGSIQQNGPLLGTNAPQPSTSLFGQPQQQQQQQLGSVGFGQMQTQQPLGVASSLAIAQQQPQQLQLGQSLGQSVRAPLWQTSGGPYPREKTIPDQMLTLFEKWSPESNNCAFQFYFYNSVAPEAVPYYVPGPGEDEQKWEEALAKKPFEGSVPVLCKGFAALGNRLRIQVQAANALQSRLHEINNSLTAMLQEHDLNVSVRAVDARRRHVALSQRCLQLATKVQVLRNRGYAMDSAEEDLKKKLGELERRSFDPQLNGRQEEIWARMVGIRERAKILDQEIEKIGAMGQDGANGGIDEDIMIKTRKILGDYDSQISHLQKEVAAIGKDFEEWEGGPTAGK